MCFVNPEKKILTLLTTKIHNMKFLSVTLFCILFLFSCKDKETVKDPCTNGFKDPGEVGIDCGGNCKPCPVSYFPSVQFNLNGLPFSFSTKNLVLSSNNYILSFSNDSVSGYLNLGTNSAIGPYPILPNGTSLTRITNFGLPTQLTKTYNNITEATYYLSSHNTAEQRMSGYFTLKFYQAGSGNDTIVITSGEFADMLY